jgi:hypothetical protein
VLCASCLVFVLCALYFDVLITMRDCEQKLALPTGHKTTNHEVRSIKYKVPSTKNKVQSTSLTNPGHLLPKELTDARKDVVAVFGVTGWET